MCCGVQFVVGLYQGGIVVAEGCDEGRGVTGGLPCLERAGICHWEGELGIGSELNTSGGVLDGAQDGGEEGWDGRQGVVADPDAA